MARQADIDRLPPHSLEDEQGALGCCLLDGTKVDEVVEKGGADLFYERRHQVIFAALHRLLDTGKPIDMVTVVGALKDQDALAGVGGPVYLSELMDCVPSALNLPVYLERLIDLRRLRVAIAVCSEAVGAAYAAGARSEGVINRLEGGLMRLVDEHSQKTEVQLKELLPGVIDRMERYHRGRGQISGLPTGFEYLDKMTGGLQAGRFNVFAARPGVGKAQPLSARVLTPTGYVTMGEVRPGDRVIGASGGWVRVVGVFPQGKKKVYRVGLSDNAETRCCRDHLWFTQTRNERRNGSAGSVKSLGEVMDTLERVDGGARNHAIPVVGPVRFKRGGKLPLHPWLLGALLGDGGLHNGNVAFHNPEPDLRLRFSDLLPVQDEAVVINRVSLRVRRRRKTNGVSETKKAVRMLVGAPLSTGKFIPSRYLRAAFEERLELLRGLLDTDGHVVSSGGSVEFSTSSERLAEDVAYLVRSLGGICRVAGVRTPAYTHKGVRRTGTCSWRMVIRFADEAVVPVSSVKHLKRWRVPKMRQHRSIVSVEPDGVEECVCIMVDSEDGLYVTDDFVVTHNTTLGMNIAEHLTVVCNVPVGFFSLEMPNDELAERLVFSHARANVQKFRTGYSEDKDLPRLFTTVEKVNGAPLWLDDSSGLNILQLRSRARRMVRMHGVKAIFVDYLGLMAGTNPRQDRIQALREATNGMKSLAKELNIPVTALAQINRESMKGGMDGKPGLHHLKDSGTIEEDADLVLMLWETKENRKLREEYEAELPASLRWDSKIQKVTVTVAKQRGGETGDTYLDFFKTCTRFQHTKFGVFNPEEMVLSAGEESHVEEI